MPEITTPTQGAITAAFTGFVSFIRTIADIIIQNIPKEFNAAVLMAFLILILVVSLYVAIAFAARIQTGGNGEWRSNREDESASRNALEDAHEQIDALKAQIKELEQNPPYSLAERIFFNVNGIANTGLFLAIAILLWEWFTVAENLSSATLKSVPKKQLTDLQNLFVTRIEDELNRAMTALVAALLISFVIVGVAAKERGRSFQIINRALIISFIIASIVFAFFVIFLSGNRNPLQG